MGPLSPSPSTTWYSAPLDPSLIRAQSARSPTRTKNNDEVSAGGRHLKTPGNRNTTCTLLHRWQLCSGYSAATRISAGLREAAASAQSKDATCPLSDLGSGVCHDGRDAEPEDAQTTTARVWRPALGGHAERFPASLLCLRRLRHMCCHPLQMVIKGSPGASKTSDPPGHGANPQAPAEFLAEVHAIAMEHIVIASLPLVGEAVDKCEDLALRHGDAAHGQGLQVGVRLATLW
eukprot:CAMPEP_0179056754 /NCGR_PEP_ID=MMETSP0796-20121207/23975_1 /TAXON_ID=73915 /ORGANISM="Pyrodinium bahamense, Strain pbaha01" /LENGTH=232 /DNA_ID=CAMNT_0020753439 /DNA_START=65 /DNA_END=763 /DNA_ORIENTATION=-